MLQKYIVFTNFTCRFAALRNYRDFDMLVTRNVLIKNQSVLYQSRRSQCTNLAARIANSLNSRNSKFSQLNTLRRNYCTEPVKNSDRSWSSLRKQHRDSKQEIRRLFSLAKNEKWYLYGAIGCLVVSSVVTLGVPRAIGKLMDMIVLDDFPKDKLHAFCIALFGIFVIGGLANFGRIYLMNSASKQRTIKSINHRYRHKFVISVTTEQKKIPSENDMAHIC